MEIFKTQTKIDFISKRYLFFVISGILILAGILSIVIRGGLNLGIDFTGGNLIQIKFTQPIQLSEIRKIFSEANLKVDQLQDFPQQNTIVVRIKSLAESSEKVAQNINNIFINSMPNNPSVIERNEYVGPAVGKILAQKAFYAIIFSSLAIIVYIAFRFKSAIWGFSGVVALLHDVFIILGILTILNHEITLLVISALLTLAGYSVSDTVVILDRIREKMRLMRNLSLGEVINLSINETLSRTVITAFSTELVLLSIFFFGGETLRDFSFALFFGIIIGTYSSIAVATPIAYEWELYKRRRTQATVSNKK